MGARVVQETGEAPAGRRARAARHRPQGGQAAHSAARAYGPVHCYREPGNLLLVLFFINIKYTGNIIVWSEGRSRNNFLPEIFAIIIPNIRIQQCRFLWPYVPYVCFKSLKSDNGF